MIFTTRIIPWTDDWFIAAKRSIQQPKNSTALKQLALLGYIVLQEAKTNLLLNTVTNNLRKNKRNKVRQSDYKLSKCGAV